MQVQEYLVPLAATADRGSAVLSRSQSVGRSGTVLEKKIVTSGKPVTDCLHVVLCGNAVWCAVSQTRVFVQRGALPASDLLTIHVVLCCAVLCSKHPVHTG